MTQMSETFVLSPSASRHKTGIMIDFCGVLSHTGPSTTSKLLSGRPLADDITYVHPGAEAPRGGCVLLSQTRARHQGEVQVLQVGKLFGPAGEDGKICLSPLSTFLQIMLEAINAPAMYVATQAVLSLLALRRTLATMMHDEFRVSRREALRSTRRCLCALRDARTSSIVLQRQKLVFQFVQKTVEIPQVRFID